MVRFAALLLSACLALVLCAGGFVHAAVPHDEGDHHSSKEIVWSSLHSVLQHEDKLFAVLAVVYVFVVGTLAAAVVVLYDMHYRIVAADQRFEQLRRGVALYRRFS